MLFRSLAFDYGLYQMIMAFANGARLVLERSFAFPAEVLRVVVEEKVTGFPGVPTIYAVLDARTEREVDTSSLRFLVCGAAPMPAELIVRFEERFGVPVVEGYGLSESSVASNINPLDGPRKPGTVGIALPGQEVAVVSPSGEQLPPGTRGEEIGRAHV